MSSIKNFYPSKFLSAGDLNGEDITATIERVDAAEFRQDDNSMQIKPVLHFKESGVKALVLNKSNSLLLGSLLGDDTDAWPGKRITMFRDLVAFKGKPTDTIRVKRAAAKADGGMPFDDRVPFAPEGR
jgi:hypothetical protein